MAHGLSLLGEAKPDAAAAEKARQQMLAHHDKASQRMLQAQLDIANVLTPAQRAQIAATLKARQEGLKERLSERAERRAAHQAARAASQPSAAIPTDGPRASAAGDASGRLSHKRAPTSLQQPVGVLSAVLDVVGYAQVTY